MSRLTATQREFLNETQQALLERGFVHLHAFSDGKTTTMDVLRSAFEKSNRKHEENYTLEFYTHLDWKRSDKLTTSTIQRQILFQAGVDDPKNKWIHNAGQLWKAWKDFLERCEEKRIIPVIAIDNAEALCYRAYSVMKELNEYYHPKLKKRIGTAILFSGRYGEIKAPHSILHYCTEIFMTRITANEIDELLQFHFNSYSKIFTQDAMEELAMCETTLEIHSTSRRAIQFKKLYNKRLIDRTTIILAKDSLPREVETKKDKLIRDKKMRENIELAKAA